MNKSLIGIIVAVIIIGSGVGIYFYMQNDEEASTDNTNTNAVAETKYEGDSYSFTQPDGWTQGHIQNTLVSFHNTEETFPEGSAAANINFKSYMALSFDSINERSLSEIYDLTVAGLQQTLPSITVVDVVDETINGLPAKLLTIQFVQQEVDYTVLIGMYMASQRYYAMSFNTTTEKWSEYKDYFFKLARSFEAE